MVETRLFFGGRISEREHVTPPQWEAFLAEVVTPRFPEGLTAIAARGQYLAPGAAEPIRESTWVLLLLHDGGPRANEALDAIVGEYKRRFRQQSVLRLDDVTAVTF